MSSPGAKFRHMAAAWGAIGVLAAISIAFFFYLGQKIDGLGQKIDGGMRTMIANKSSARRVVLIGAIVAVSVAGAGLLRPSAKATAPQDRSKDYPQLIRIWMHGEAIYPPIIRAKPGKILLRAENRTQTDVALVLDRLLPGAARQRAARVSTVSRAQRADLVLALGVGEYEYYDEGFPEAKGKLIVEP